MEFEYEVRGAHELAAKFRLAAAAIPALMGRAIETTAHELEGLARQLAPIDTGGLRMMVFSKIRVLTRVWEAIVSDRAHHALWVERGTGVYGPLMRPFYVHRGVGGYYHRGMEAREFLYPALARSMPLIEVRYDRLVTEIVDII